MAKFKRGDDVKIIGESNSKKMLVFEVQSNDKYRCVFEKYGDIQDKIFDEDELEIAYSDDQGYTSFIISVPLK